MIYTEDDVKEEIHRYFTQEIEGNNADIIKNTVKLVEDILILANEDILAACHNIKDIIVNVSIDGVKVYKDRKFLPEWVKDLVYVVIYQYLKKEKDTKKAKYNQSTLLVEMGLYADIFGKKNWNMYSPDMKVEQSEYETVKLPFNHAEVEANVIFRAMIHYMVCYSKVLTDTFVDVFGKLGVIPALCAKGYKSSQVWLEHNNYNQMQVFVKALKKKKRVSKYLCELQYKIKHSDNPSDTINKIIEKTMRNNFYIASITNIEEALLDDKKCGIDIYEYAAYYIVQQYFTPEYWLDKNLKKEKIDEGSYQFLSELEYHLSNQRVEKFIERNFTDDIEKLATEYGKKRFSLEKVSAKYAIKCLNDTYYYREDGSVADEVLETDMLYIDVPKYLREEKRFDFDIEYFFMLFDVLSEYQGDWIMTWKNYVEVPKVKLSENRSGDEYTKRKDSLYCNIYTEGKICSLSERMYVVSSEEFLNSGYEENDTYEWVNEEEFPNETDSVATENQIMLLYERMLKISEKRQLYVFRYIDDDRNHPNSIIFITTINFPQISDKEFTRQYGLEFYNEGRLKKAKFEEFYKDTKKFYNKK